MPSRRRASKTPPTEPNKNYNSKQEFHESQVKIFKWKSNPVTDVSIEIQHSWLFEVIYTAEILTIYQN